MTRKVTAALKETSAVPTEADHPVEALDILWGCAAIASVIRRPVRDTYYLLQQGHLDADKCGDLWVSTRDRLRRQFSGKAAA